jgi:hypothetical protein
MRTRPWLGALLTLLLLLMVGVREREPLTLLLELELPLRLWLRLELAELCAEALAWPLAEPLLLAPLLLLL